MDIRADKLVLTATVVECVNQTITVKGLPFWYTFYPNMWVVSGTDIDIIDYIGTTEIGILYLSKPVQIESGKHINLTYK